MVTIRKFVEHGLALPLLRGVAAAKCPSIGGFSAANIPTTNPGLLSAAIFSVKTTVRVTRTSKNAPGNEPSSMLLITRISDLFYIKHSALTFRVSHILPWTAPLPASRSSVGIGGSVSLASITVGDWSKPRYCSPVGAFVLWNGVSRLLSALCR